MFEYLGGGAGEARSPSKKRRQVVTTPPEDLDPFERAENATAEIEYGIEEAEDDGYVYGQEDDD